MKFSGSFQKAKLIQELIFNEAQHIQGFLQLLFKPRNTDLKWQKEEKQQLKNHLKRLSLYMPILIIFTLPGGSLLLPILAEILDRRKNAAFQVRPKSRSPDRHQRIFPRGNIFYWLYSEEEKGIPCFARIFSAAKTPRYWTSSKIENPLKSEWAK